MLHNPRLIDPQLQGPPGILDVGPHFKATFFSEVITNHLFQGQKQGDQLRGQSPVSLGGAGRAPGVHPDPSRVFEDFVSRDLQLLSRPGGEHH